MGRGNGLDGLWEVVEHCILARNPDLAVLLLPVNVFNIVQHS